MADKKITELAAAGSVLATDILPIVIDPGGSPETKKVTLSTVRLLLNSLDTGWIEDGGSWAYASAATATRAGASITLFPVGTKIRYKQGGGFKYGYVTGVSGTTVTINGGSDYTLANAAITDVAYSYVSSPANFPHWFAWTPAWTGMTVTGSPIYTGKFSIVGQTAQVIADINGNGGTTASAAGTTYFALPITATGGGMVTVSQVAQPSISGVGSVWATQNRAYTPVWAANGGYFTIFSQYQI
jgi:hypothetical protein